MAHALRSLAAAASLAALAFVALPAHAQYVPYSELRQDFAGITAAVNSLPSSDIHGTFNRISALYRRAPIRDVARDDLNQVIEGTPPNFRRGLEAALEDLAVDLQAASDAWEADEPGVDRNKERFILLQVLDAVVVERAMELHHGNTVFTCEPEDALPGTTCPPDPLNPPLIGDLDAVVDAVRPWIAGVISYLESQSEENDGGLYNGVRPNGAFLEAVTFSVRIDEIRDVDGVVVHGEPIIDY